jgi:hypothetical protein
MTIDLPVEGETAAERASIETGKRIFMIWVLKGKSP